MWFEALPSLFLVGAFVCAPYAIVPLGQKLVNGNVSWCNCNDNVTHLIILRFYHFFRCMAEKLEINTIDFYTNVTIA